MEAFGIDILIAVWLVIFGSMLLAPLTRRGDDSPTTDETAQATPTPPAPFGLREIAAIVSDRDLSQVA